jgi:hypothetical protein
LIETSISKLVPWEGSFSSMSISAMFISPGAISKSSSSSSSASFFCWRMFSIYICDLCSSLSTKSDISQISSPSWMDTFVGNLFHYYFACCSFKKAASTRFICLFSS